MSGQTYNKESQKVKQNIENDHSKISNFVNISDYLATKSIRVTHGAYLGFDLHNYLGLFKLSLFMWISVGFIIAPIVFEALVIVNVFNSYKNDFPKFIACLIISIILLPLGSVFTYLSIIYLLIKIINN